MRVEAGELGELGARAREEWGPRVEGEVCGKPLGTGRPESPTPPGPHTWHMAARRAPVDPTAAITHAGQARASMRGCAHDSVAAA